MNVHPLDEDSRQPVALPHRINSSLSLVYSASEYGLPVLLNSPYVNTVQREPSFNY